MAVFESKYKELGFYAKGRLLNFNGGRYVTEDDDVIAVLEKLTDAERVDEPKTEEAPKPKAPRKSSGK